MLEPQKMDRVLIVGTKDVMETTINKLHELNLLHVEDYVEEEAYFHMGKPLKAATPLSEKLLKLRSIKSYLGTKEVIPEKEKQERSRRISRPTSRRWRRSSQRRRPRKALWSPSSRITSAGRSC